MCGSILIVDDEPGILNLVDRVLKRAGLETDTAQSGQAALECLAGKEYDLVLVDLRMPEIDGFQVLEWIEENRPATVAVVLSGTTLVEDVIKAMQRGAFDFVTKPIEARDIFVQQVHRALEHKRLQDHNRQLLHALQEKNVELENRLGQLALAHSLLQSQAMAVQADLNHARAIQQGLLPKELPLWDRVAMSAYYRPAGKVGGDFYDVFQLDERRLGLYIADTTGHGISSALITVFLKHSVRPIADEGNGPQIVDPGLLLRALNARIFEEPFGRDLFISMTYLVFDTETLELHYSSAGHPPFLVRNAAGQVEQLRVPAPALGINPEVKYTTATHQVERTSTIILHTDGVTDVQNDTGEFFGRNRLWELIGATQGDVSAFVNTIETNLVRFSGSMPFPDDIAILVLRAEPQASPIIGGVEEPAPVEEHAATAGRGILTAHENGCMYVSVAGSGTWRESKYLIEVCDEARTAGQQLLVLDFARCTHLDSTFLGVLHNICSEAEDQQGFRVQLQNLPRVLLKEMSELGLTSVLLHFRSNPKALPSSMAVAEGEAPADAEMGRLLLHAHEALVKADPKNADRFAAVLKVLHEQAGRKLHPIHAPDSDSDDA